MPLATRASKSAEPKNKRPKVAPVEKKPGTRGRPSKKPAAVVTESSSEDEEMVPPVVQPPTKQESKKETSNGDASMELDEPVKAKPSGKAKKEEKPTKTEEAVMSDITNQNGEAAVSSNQDAVKSYSQTKPGFVLAVGENLSNQLGLGLEIDNRKKPQIVKQLPTNIIQIASGGMHSAALSQDGTVSYP